MTVELGALDARKARAAADRHAAGSAHARSVDHQRIEADDRPDAVLLRRPGDELHHDHRADRDHFVVTLALPVDQVAHQVGHHTVKSGAAVVRSDEYLARHGARLIGKDQRILVLRPDDDVGLHAALRQPLDLRIDRSGPDAAGHEKDPAAAQRLGLLVHELGRAAQRTGEIGQRVALAHRAQLRSGIADRLRDDRHPPLLGIVVGNSQRNAFSVLVQPDDDELSRPGRAGHARSLDVHQVDVGRQQFFLDNLVHAICLV